MTSWITKLIEHAQVQREASGAAPRRPAAHIGNNTHKAWLTQLRDAAEAIAEQSDDPWEPTLRELKGHVGGVERIATFRVFELLGVPPRAQSSDIRRRLVRRMAELGWQPIRCHGMNERSFLTRVRGFARPADHEGTPLLPPNTTKAGRRPQPLM
jgi:hypothetical protein